MAVRRSHSPFRRGSKGMSPRVTGRPPSPRSRRGIHVRLVVVSVPKELVVNLTRPEQIFQLFQASKGSGVEDFARHVDFLKQPPELIRTRCRVSLAAESWEAGIDF